MMTCSHVVIVRYTAGALILAPALLFAPLAHATWTTSPVEVYATAHECPQVAATPDGSHGAIVVWQEATVGALGPLRAQHLLASGDIDPAWGGPVGVSDTAVARSALVAVADGTGGAYVSWLEGLDLYLTHVDPDGARSAGWPARGRYLGSEYDAGQRPRVIEDGAGGIYVAWHQPSDPTPSRIDLMLAHLGPDNTTAGGFPASGVRAIGAVAGRVEWVCTSAIDLAPDHGLWLALGSMTWTPGARSGFRLVRLSPAGEPSPGWNAGGVTIGVFDVDVLVYGGPTGAWTEFNAMSLVGVASDGAGGAFVDRGDVINDRLTGQPGVAPRLLRYGANGALDPGWPVAGLPISEGPFSLSFTVPSDMGDGASLRAIPDGAGGVYASYSLLAGTDSRWEVRFDHYSSTGNTLGPGAAAALDENVEVTPSGDGGLLKTSCKPWGPYSPWTSPASIFCGLSNAGHFSEYQAGPVLHFYGDVGAAATGDGGAIFCWSQLLGRQGIYAVRLAGSGLAGAPPVPPVVASRLALHFAPGDGVHVRAVFATGGEARFVLTDVAGRAITRDRFTATVGERAWTPPGTAGLPAGLYFARIEGAGRTLTARVVVAR